MLLKRSDSVEKINQLVSGTKEPPQNSESGEATQFI